MDAVLLIHFFFFQYKGWNVILVFLPPNTIKSSRTGTIVWGNGRPTMWPWISAHSYLFFLFLFFKIFLQGNCEVSHVHFQLLQNHYPSQPFIMCCFIGRNEQWILCYNFMKYMCTIRGENVHLYWVDLLHREVMHRYSPFPRRRESSSHMQIN